MKHCDHENLDFEEGRGNGYIRCADCGKSIPIENGIKMLARRVRELEQTVQLLVAEAAYHEEKADDGK